MIRARRQDAPNRYSKARLVELKHGIQSEPTGYASDGLRTPPQGAQQESSHVHQLMSALVSVLDAMPGRRYPANSGLR